MGCKKLGCSDCLDWTEKEVFISLNRSEVGHRISFSMTGKERALMSVCVYNDWWN